MTNALFQEAKAAVTHEDQTVDAGGFDFLSPAGKTQARFIGYVECGDRADSYDGKPKPDVQEVRVYFELNGKKHRNEVVADGVTKTFTNVQSERLQKKFGEKATYRKLFEKMRYGRDGITHMKDMLGESFLIDIEHNTVAASEGKPAKTFANMRNKNDGWLIGAPSITALNAEGDMVTTAAPAPEITQPVKLLLWEAPSQAQWDSLFIDGTRTQKDAKGVETQVSKNWLQEDILTKALDFEGSALQSLLGGLADLSIGADDEVVESAQDTVQESENPAPVETVAKVEEAPVVDPVATVGEPAATKPAPVEKTDDILGDLGL